MKLIPAIANTANTLFRSVDNVLSSISGLENPQNWLGESFRVGNFDSGVTVNARSIQQIPAYISGVRVLAETLGSLPLKLIKTTENQITVEKSHPLFYLVCKQPNQIQTRQVFWETVMRYCINSGNAFAAIIRDSNATPQELILIHEKKKVEVIESLGKLYYRVEGIEEIIPSENMLHFKGIGDGIVGIGCIEYAMTTAGISLASQKNQAKFFKGGSQLDGVLEHPKQLSKDAAVRLRNSWHDTYHTGDPKARVAVLEEGMVFKPISISPEAAKYLETLKHGAYDIAAILRVPPHMIAQMDFSTNNNIEHQSLDFVKFSFLPWATRFESELNTKLLTEAEKKADELSFSFNLEGLLRGDFKSRMDGYRIAINAGIKSQNECRKLENLAPFEGGDRKWIQMNMMPLDKVDEILERNGNNQKGNQSGDPDN